MSRAALLGLLVLPTSLLGSSREASAESALTEGKDYVVLERVRFLDRMGFDRPVEAFSMLFPRGWRTDGGVKWLGLNQCRADLVSMVVTATSPDGALRFEALPSRSFNWTNEPMMQQALMAGAQQGDCAVNQPFDARQYLEGFARQDLGATASDIRIDEASMARMRPIDEQANAIARQYGNDSQQQTTLVYGKITFRDGSEAIAHVGVNNTVMRRADMMTGAAIVTTTTSVFHFVMLRHPPARRAEASRLLAMLMASHRVNPIWKQAKESFLTQLGNIEHKGRMDKIRLMGEQAQAYAKAAGEASDARMRAWEVRQAADDRQHRAFVQTIREVETWKDGSGAVELSSGYGQAWSRGDGTYLLSNSASFDPAAAFQDRRWTEMKKAR